MADGEHYSYFSIVRTPKSHPDILIEVILIKKRVLWTNVESFVLSEGGNLINLRNEIKL